jgi:hypothetical protein
MGIVRRFCAGATPGDTSIPTPPPLPGRNPADAPGRAAVAIRHGIPADRQQHLAELLDEARRLHVLGRPAAEVRRSVLALNRELPLPLPAFSAGGLVECVNAVLAEEAGGRHG